MPPGIMVVNRPDGSRDIRHDVNGKDELVRMVNDANKVAESSDIEAMQSDPQTSEQQQ